MKKRNREGKCDAVIENDDRALCDKPAIWCSQRELEGGGLFHLYFCVQHEERARRPVPGVRLIRVDRIKEPVM